MHRTPPLPSPSPLLMYMYTTLARNLQDKRHLEDVQVVRGWRGGKTPPTELLGQVEVERCLDISNGGQFLWPFATGLQLTHHCTVERIARRT